MNVIVTGALGATPEEFEILEALGMEITLHPDERTPVSEPERFEAAICNGLFLHNPIETFCNLKYIQLTSAGMDRVPLSTLESRGIILRSAAGVYSVPMAEWTVMRILELYRGGNKRLEPRKERIWKKDVSWQELSGKTACILGLGAYGQETAKRLKAFGVTVIAVNRTEKQCPWVDHLYKMNQLDFAVSQGDIIILAMGLAAETKHLLGERQFSAMKPGAILINAARGGLVDTRALLKALDDGILAGAALDVFEQEPLPESSELWNREEILLSCHNAFVGDNTHKRMMDTVIRNWKQWKFGEKKP